MEAFYLGATIVCLTVVLLLESVIPLHQGAVPLARWLRNLALSALALAATMAVPVAFWMALKAFRINPADGLFARWGVAGWLQWPLTIVLLDGLAYALHRLSHRWHWFWRLHAVHHSDVQLDATTTHRHHPLENLVTTLAMLPLLIALAPPPLAVVAYALLALGVVTLAHGNLKLPAALDRVLRWCIVTPAFHRVHHSAWRPQTDSNYATVFPFFDYLFRSASAVPDDGGHGLVIGLETARDAADQTLGALLAAPFRRARPVSGS